MPANLFGGEHDPRAFGRLLGRLVLIVPLAFLLAVSVGLAPHIFGVSERLALSVFSFLVPSPLLGAAYAGMIWRELPWRWGVVLRHRPAKIVGLAFLLLYAGIVWFLYGCLG